MGKETRCFDNTFHAVALRHLGTAQPDPPLLMWPDVLEDDQATLTHARSRHMDFFALYIVQRGQGTHIIEETPYAISRGDVYVMGLGATHSYAQCRNLVVQGLYFTPALFDAATRQALGEVPCFASLVPGLITADGGTNRAGRWLHLAPAAYEQVARELAELHAEWASPRPGGALALRGLFTCLLIHLARFQSEAHATHTDVRTGAHSDAVTAAMSLMEERYAEPLHIGQVAAAVFLSRHQFTRLFSQAVGQTPRAYLRHIRIERAKALLGSTRLSMGVIAGQSGFGEPPYFARAFRAATGMTPGDYRSRSQSAGDT